MSANGGQIVVDFSIDNGKAIVAVKQAGQVLQQLKGSLDSTAASVKKLEQGHDSLGRKFRDVVLTMGNLRFVAMDVNDIFLRLPLAILKSSSELEKMQILMKGLSKEITEAGRIAEAQKGFDFVTRMAKNAPFELKALSDTFVKLKTAGIDPMKGSMQALVDSVAKFGGTGDTLKRASVAIQQMAGKGVISMEELRQQLGEAIPTAMQDMADQMGMSMGELAKIVSTGTLAAGPALDKMLLRMKVNNSGAAQEMMKTWSGMTERLKTELALMSQEVANGGLGDAAKGAIGEVTKALSSDEMKRFAASAGAELGEAVRIIMSAVKTLVEWRNEIKLAAEAWLAFKIVGPLIENVVASAGRMREASARAGAAALEAATRQRAAAVETATAHRNAALAAEKAANDAIAAKSREVIAQERAIDSLLAKQAVLNNALANRRGTEVIVPALSGVPSLAGAQSVDTVTRANQKLSEELRRQQALAVASKLELNALGYAHGGVAKEVANTTSHLRALETSTIAATAAQRAMAAGASLVRGALALVGGGIGLVTIALIAGAEAWRRWAAAAEEANARKRRAEKKLSTQEDLDKTNDDLKSAVDDLNRRKQFVGGQGIFLPKNASAEQKAAAVREIENRQRAVDEAQRKVDDLQKTRSMQQQSLRESDARDQAEGFARQSETVINAASEATEKELAASRARQSKLTSQDKKTVEERKKETDLQTQLFIRQKKEQNAVLESEMAKMRTLAANVSAPQVERDAAQRRIQEMASQLKANTDEIVSMVEANDRKIEKVGKDKKGDKKKAEPIGYSKVDSLIGGLEAQRAQLQTEIDSFNATLGVVDKGLAAAAALEAKAKAGAFKYRDDSGKKVVDVTPEELNKAKTLARQNADLKNALDLAEQVATKGRDIEGDYKQALAILADPLGGLKVSDRGQLGAFEDLLAKANLDLDKFASSLGITVEEARRRIDAVKSQLATIDGSKVVAQIAQDTRTANVEIIASDRERLAAQLQIETDTYLARNRGLIAWLGQHGWTVEQVKQAEKALSDWQIANAQVTAERMKTPMQRLADQWRDSTKNMQEASAQWAQQGIDTFINFTKTGKLEWQSLVTDILAGYLKIKMQKELVGLLDFGKGSGGSAPSGGGGDGSSIWSSIGNWFSGLFTFADGGIMSQFGSVPLRKYATGGIANSPQLALYGEGSMNEAFVPLPDGRSIPVTMKGAGQGDAAAPKAQMGDLNVQVNVINQTGTPVTATQGAPRLDAGQMVLDVVLAAASRPGPFRDNMKQAFGAQ